MNKRFAIVMAGTLLSAGALAQSTVKGTVISQDDGMPIVGATIRVEGTNTGTVTDIDGNFSVAVPASNKKLRIEYIGMESKTVAAKDGITIKLVPSEKDLDEVLVVAYGKQKRSAFTGSAGVVSADELKDRVVSNVTNAMSGQVAGVQVLNSNGQPGSDATIRVRGIGSISSSNDPLIILDGVPYEGNISSINPTDIASLTVLKDAASNAIYGARGANGVVLITTKQGNSKEAKVTFDAKWGTNSRAIPQYDVISSPGEYYETMFKALYNSKAYHGSTAAEAYAYANDNLFNVENGGLGYQIYTVPKGENLIGTNFKLNPNAKLGYTDGQYYYTPDDWYKEAISSNLRQEYNATVSGKTDRMNYYASVGYLDDNGIVTNSSFKRYSARVNADYQAKKWLKVGTNMAYAYSDNQSPYGQTSDSWGSTGNLFYIVNSIAPIYPLYVRNADGSIMINSGNGKKTYDSGTNTSFRRPSLSGNAVRDLDYNSYHDYRDLFTGKWYANITPIEGLTLTANIAANIQNDRYNYLYSPFGSSISSDGSVSVTSTRSMSVNNQYMAQYQKLIGGVHNVDFLLGYEQFRLRDQYFGGSNTHLYDPFIGELDNAGSDTDKYLSSYTNKYMSEGIFARAQYDYDGKYFFSASFRRDASSRFSKDNRWGNFGSVGAAWLLTKEDFMKDLTWINSLKYKVSWGVQGNDNILYSNSEPNYYAYRDQYTMTYNNGSYSLVMKYKGNKDLTWETSYSFNTGFEFELLNRRLNGSFDFFYRKTDDLLFNNPVPVSSGITTGSIPINAFNVSNTGFEFDLNGVIIKTKDIEWAANLNLTHYKNKILKLTDELDAQGGQKGAYYIRRVGGSLYESYLKRFAGVDPDNGQALYYVDPDNGDWSTTSNYDAAQLSDCGDILPKVYGGFGTTIKAYGFDLSASFSYQLGGKFYDGTYQSFMHNGGSGMQGFNWHKDILNAWTPENRYTNVPRLDASDACYQLDSDRYLVSSDYLSVNNITLGYTLPKSLLEKIGISGLRVYVSGDNLGVISARKGLDPRESFGLGSSTHDSGASQSSYSVMKSIVGGISLTF